MNALIIDDEISIFALLKQILKSKNYTSTHAGTLTQAKQILAEMQPDVIFLDHRLPDGFGFDFIPALCKMCPNARIIAMTAQDIAQNKEKVMNDGAHYFLPKPFLVNKVYEALIG
jgi:two-component system, OmpR family, response regulator